jgi:poly(3-hydroxybutyrate) depolymerase
MTRDYPDVELLDTLVAQIEGVACTAGDVTVSGLGNGAMMAHRWACESDVPDAIMTAGGTLQMEEGPRTRPLPGLHYHGDEDTWAPADGSMGHRPAEHGLGLWRGINGVTGEGVVEADGELSCTNWTGNKPVTYCIVDGGFHGWPGAADMPVASEHSLADATPAGVAWLEAARAVAVPRPHNDVPDVAPAVLLDEDGDAPVPPLAQ